MESEHLIGKPQQRRSPCRLHVMKTILQFIWDVKLSKPDEAVLIEHVEASQEKVSGPGLSDKCTNTVRHFLKANPPVRGPGGMSWEGFVKLEDALNQGFTSKQAYKMAIPAIGIVAVLVANVTFVAWTTPPGGSNPPWIGCNYPLYTAFLIVNGVAFVLSVASTVVVTAFPLVLSKTPHQAVKWGGILLIVSMLSFIAAFLLAGYVTVGYKAPAASCSNLLCTEGGIACRGQVLPWSEDQATFILAKTNMTVFGLDANVAALNSIADFSSIAVCVTYNKSVSHGSYTTLIPQFMPFSYPGVSQETTDAVAQLYEDFTTQVLTVCMDRADMPHAIDSNIDRTTLEVNVSGDIPDLPEYLLRTQLSLFNILPNGDFDKLWSYVSLLVSCLSQNTAKQMPNDVLCEQSWKMVGPHAGNSSVDKSGAYIKAATAADSDAVIFGTDVTSQEVSRAVHALVGVFTLICLTIAVFLIRSKVNH